MQLLNSLKLTSTLLLMLLSIGLSAQQSLNKVKNAPLHAGDGRTFEQPMKAMIKMARQACTEAGLVMESSERIDEDTYMILSKAKTSAFSWGEVVRIVLEQKEASKTVMRVYTRKRIGINVTAKASYTNTIFTSVESQIEFGD